MPALSLYRVTKRFRDYNSINRWLRRELVDLITGKRSNRGWWTVLNDINLDIDRGETVALIGRNGSGKSTLLKLMAGILRPTSGKVTRSGSICTLFDIGTGFHEDLTGRENVYVNGAILGLSEAYIKTAFPQIVDFAELEGFIDTPLKFYSSGMKARLGFAVAMTANPDIFLIDEVLAVGDEGFRRKCYTKLDELVSEGRTIILVSHDMEAIRRLCSRAVWLHKGEIRADGPVTEVCSEYYDYYDSAASTPDAAGGIV